LVSFGVINILALNWGLTFSIIGVSTPKWLSPNYQSKIAGIIYAQWLLTAI
jgi:hypothetical protein